MESVLKELVALLYGRWEIRNPGSYSAESLSINGNGVWLFLAGAPKDGMAIVPHKSVEKYFLKLKWGKTPSNAFELSKNYSVEDFKNGIGWLISNNRILVLHLEAVKAYLAADKERIYTWNKHRGDIGKIMAQYKTHVPSK
jgi:hypothetical protein